MFFFYTLTFCNVLWWYLYWVCVFSIMVHIPALYPILCTFCSDKYILRCTILSIRRWLLLGPTAIHLSKLRKPDVRIRHFIYYVRVILEKAWFRFIANFESAEFCFNTYVPIVNVDFMSFKSIWMEVMKTVDDAVFPHFSVLTLTRKMLCSVKLKPFDTPGLPVSYLQRSVSKP